MHAYIRGEKLTKKTLFYADVAVFLVENFTKIRTIVEEFSIPNSYSIIWPEASESKNTKYQVKPGQFYSIRYNLNLPMKQSDNYES